MSYVIRNCVVELTRICVDSIWLVVTHFQYSNKPVCSPVDSLYIIVVDSLYIIVLKETSHGSVYGKVN